MKIISEWLKVEALYVQNHKRTVLVKKKKGLRIYMNFIEEELLAKVAEKL